LAWALSIGLIAYLVGAATAGRSTVADTDVVKAYASGTALHVDALEGGGTRVVDAEAAFSAANVDSTGFDADSRLTENSVAVQPVPDDTDPPTPYVDKNASARGAGIELGLGDSVPPLNPGSVLPLTRAGSVAPPDGPVVSNDLGPVNQLEPLAYASLLHSDAFSQWEEPTCLTSPQSPISYGRGYAADVELVDADATAPDGSLGSPVVATDDADPNRNAVQSNSFIYAIPNGTAGHYGLVSEIHQTYAPIEIVQDPLTGGTLEIEVLGEWFVKTVANGVDQATMVTGVTDSDPTSPTYGEPISPDATVIRISAGGSEVATFSLNDLGEDGVNLPLAPIADITLGESPRAISAPGGLAVYGSAPTLAADGTRAAGALDVVRIDALDQAAPGLSLADLRIGHFENDLQVPDGGFTCPSAATTTTSTTIPGTTTTTLAPTTTTSTTAAPTTTTTTLPGTTTTTIAPSTTTTVAPTTTTTAPTPPPAPPAVPIRVQPKTVG
jgi:hypothetical protein